MLCSAPKHDDGVRLPDKHCVMTSQGHHLLERSGKLQFEYQNQDRQPSHESQQAADNPGVVAWYEVHPENYFGLGGLPHFFLEKIRQDHPVSFHGVGMSIGSVDKLDKGHLKRLNELIN